MALKPKTKPAIRPSSKVVPAVEPESVDLEELVTIEIEEPEVEEVEEAPRSGRLDETTPGGRYLVGGRLVNADGEPI